MALLMDNRNVEVTLWRESGRDASNRPTFFPPVVITCRYFEKTTVFLDAQGKQLSSATSIVTEELPLVISDKVLLGAFIDPTPPATARAIMKVRQMRFVSNNTDRWQGYL